jgi:hypothetical protein
MNTTIEDQIGAMLSSIRTLSEEEMAAHEWKNTIKPALAGIGIENRHQARMTAQFCAEQKAVFRALEKFCVGKGAIVVLSGNRGCGKTTVAAQFMRERLEARNAWFSKPEVDRVGACPREPGRYYKLTHISSMFKQLFADFGGVDTETLRERYEHICSMPFLVIDEIHDGDDLKTQARLLIDLLDRRYAKLVDTVLISNHDPEAFRNEMNASILSRISEDGAIIPCLWQSFRSQK